MQAGIARAVEAAQRARGGVGVEADLGAVGQFENVSLGLLAAEGDGARGAGGVEGARGSGVGRGLLLAEHIVEQVGRAGLRGGFGRRLGNGPEHPREDVVGHLEVTGGPGSGERERGGDFVVAVHAAVGGEVEADGGLHAEEVEEGVGVFGATEAAELAAALGALAVEEDIGEVTAQPRDEGSALRGRGLLLVLGRHGAGFEGVEGAEPVVALGGELVSGARAGELDAGLGLRARVAFGAVGLEQRLDAGGESQSGVLGAGEVREEAEDEHGLHWK